MQHDGSERGPAHPAIGNSHHVFDAGARQFQGDLDVARLGHAGRAFGADVFKHQHISCRDIEIVPVDTINEIFEILEHHRAPFVFHEFGVGCGLLDDGATRCQIAIQHRDATLRVNGLVERPHYVLDKARTGKLDLFTERTPGDSQGIEVQQGFKFTKQRGHTASLVEVLHVVLAGGLEVEQHRGLSSHPVQCVQVNVLANPPRNCRQMNDAIGRSANGQQHPHGIFKCGGREYFVDGQALMCHLHGSCSGRFGDADAVRCHSRRRCTSWHGHAQCFGDAGHGAGRAHHRASSHAGHQLIVDLSSFLSIDFTRPVFAPVAAAVGAGTDTLAAMGARQHGTCDQLNGRNTGGRRTHQLRRHRFIATTNQYHRVHGLRTNHFFRIHRHQVS